MPTSPERPQDDLDHHSHYRSSKPINSRGGNPIESSGDVGDGQTPGKRLEMLALNTLDAVVVRWDAVLPESYAGGL